ncbi:MAG: glutathione S-transferase C-terminal domain-containing protein [Paracoccaceae bacterium]
MEEQFIRANKDITAIQTLLADQPFLFGDVGTAADASVVPMLRAIAASVTKTELRERVAGDPVLMVYLDRGRAAMYPA